MDKPSFERIHNINPQFNRIFAIPIYIVSLVVVLLLFISPYFVRLAIAFLINLFMNRPIVYLSTFAEKIGRPVNSLFFRFLYFSLFAIYAIGFQIWVRATGANANKSVRRPLKASGDEKEDLRFQS